MIGRRFGRLTVLEQAGVDDRHNRIWRCLCDCGEEYVVLGLSMTGGRTKSCGCLRREFQEQVADRAAVERRPYTRIAYRNLIARQRRKATSRVCARWLNGEGGRSGWECFYADMGPRPQDYKLVRNDQSKPYSVVNCRWMRPKA